jgi:hypothetical protein
VVGGSTVEATQTGLPDMEVIEKLMGQNFSYAEIGALYGVTANAVYKKRARAARTNKRNRFDAEVPWVVSAGHDNATAVRYLRLLAKRNRGLEVAEDDGRRLDQWLKMLAENNYVIGYDPNLPADHNANGIAAYGPHGGWFIAFRDEVDKSWPSVITDRDMFGRHRAWSDVNPALN